VTGKKTFKVEYPEDDCTDSGSDVKMRKVTIEIDKDITVDEYLLFQNVDRLAVRHVQALEEKEQIRERFIECVNKYEELRVKSQKVIAKAKYTKQALENGGSSELRLSITELLEEIL